MSSARIFGTFVRLGWADRLLLIEATAWIGAARVAVLLLPFRVLSRGLGTSMAETPSEDDVAHQETLRRVAWAIGAAGRRVPWRAKCLEQAIAAKMLLRARGVPNTLYLGVARDAAEAVSAHAWLRSGSRCITGGDGSTRFAVVSTFADDPGRS